MPGGAGRGRRCSRSGVCRLQKAWSVGATALAGEMSRRGKRRECGKHEVLVKRNNALNRVQDFISNNLHPKKQNILDENLPGYTKAPSIDSILNSLDLTYDEYEEFLCISPDKDKHLHLKRSPDSCFVNNYFSEGLSAWEANIDSPQQRFITLCNQ